MSQKYVKQGHQLKNAPGVVRVPGSGEIVSYGSQVPPITTRGYAAGSIYIANAFVAGATWYINQGTYTSCNFVPFDSSFGQLVITGLPATIASATLATYSEAKVAAGTLTVTGTTTITALEGIGLYLDVPTVTDSSAVTITTISNLYVGLPVAAGMVTGTNIYAAHFAGQVKIDGNINMSAGATTETLIANTASASVISDGTTNYQVTDTRNTVTGVTANLFSGSAPTIASATGDTYHTFGVSVAGLTVTLTGTTLVTALDGLGAYLGVPTITDTMACTVTTISNLYVGLPVAAGMITGTNIYTANFAGQVKVQGNINMTDAAHSILFPAGTALGLTIGDGTNASIVIDTTANVTGKTHITITNPAVTIAGASGSTNVGVQIAAKTLTTSTTTTITALNGLQLAVGTITINQSGGAVTVTTASSAYFQKPVAGSSVTITNNYIINTDVAGCFCTAAGTWTSVSNRASKKNIRSIDTSEIPALIDQVNVVTFQKKDENEGDGPFTRYGVIADECPDFMAMPGRQGIGAIYMAGFGLAAVKYLKEQLDKALARIEQLEAKAA